MVDVPLPTAADFEAAGLYDPTASGAAGRLALLEYLVSLGATLDDFNLVGREELPTIASLVGLFPERETTRGQGGARERTLR